MPGFKDYLRQQFPGIRITSGRRDPNSRLGRANPRSYHNRGMAWDTAPVEGMTFQQYVDRIGQDYDVLEARDEVNNPSKHATGPHWHVAVGGRKERPQVNNLASLMQGVYPMAQQEAQGAQPTSLADLIGQGALQPSFAPMTQENTPMPQMPKPKLFGEGGRGWQILGIIGDALQTAGGGQGTYMPYVAKQQELETEGRQRLAELLERQRQRQEERAADREDWIFRRDHPGQNPMQRDLEAWNAMSEEERAQYAAMQDIRSPIAVSGPTGTYRVPRGYGQPTNTPMTQVVNGQTYYNINGEWYDNPEGR